MEIKQKNYFFNVVSFIIFISLLAYVTFRAYNLSFIHDESLSYKIIHGGFQWENTANNHILNTDLMRIASRIFGDSELSLRLPNVLLFVVYLLACHLIFRKSQNLWLGLMGISLLLFNPFILDYFSLARGYGLSLGFMLLSLYYLFRRNLLNYSYRSIIEDFIFSMFFAMLALFSNLATINYFISVLLLFIFQYIWLSIKKFNLPPGKVFVFAKIAVFFLIPLFFAVKRLLLLSNSGQLYFGAESLYDTLNSLIIGSIYYAKYNDFIVMIIKYLIYTVFSLGILIVILKKNFYDQFFKITFLLMSIIAGLIMEHYIFGAKYPLERTATYLIPLSALFIYFFAINLIESSWARYANFFSILLCLIFALPVLYNFAVNSNLNYTYGWKYDAHTKDVVKIMQNQAYNKKTSGDKSSISSNWLFEPTLNYYIRSRNLNFGLVDNKGPNQNTDFIYEFTAEYDKLNFQEVSMYNDIGASLFLKKDQERDNL